MSTPTSPAPETASSARLPECERLQLERQALCAAPAGEKVRPAELAPPERQPGWIALQNSAKDGSQEAVCICPALAVPLTVKARGPRTLGT